jgi:hypothetical protein
VKKSTGIQLVPTIKSTKIVALTILTCFLMSGCSLLGRLSGGRTSTMWSKPDVLCDYPTTDKLASGAKIAGKIALVTKNFTVNPSNCYLDGHFNDPSKGAVTGTKFFPEEMYATKPEEIDTLIKVETKRGDLLNSFSTDGVNRVKVYSSLIEISVIDYKASAVIAKERFEFKEFPRGESSGSIPISSTRRVKDTDGGEVHEYIVPETKASYNAIKTHLAKYSGKVKPAETP